MPRKPTSRRTASTTSCEVFPRGLSTTRIPSNGSGCISRDIRSSLNFAQQSLLPDEQVFHPSLKTFRRLGLFQKLIDVLAIFFRFIKKKYYFRGSSQSQAFH